MPNHNQVKLSALDPLVLCQLNANCGFSMSTACGEQDFGWMYSS